MSVYISASELRNGSVFEDSGNVYVVIKYGHIKKARAQAVVKVKVRDIRSGSVTEKSYSSDTKVVAADVVKRSAQYLYSDGSHLYFMDSTTFEQMSVNEESLGFDSLVLKEGEKVIVEYLNEEPVSVAPPASVELEVIEAPDAVSTGTVSNPSKRVKLETGLEIFVPMFINKGDVVKVNTEDSSYITRV